MELLLRRAQAVANYLLARKWISGNAMEIYGKGENNPVATNGSSAGWRKNRRVKIIIFKTVSDYLK